MTPWADRRKSDRSAVNCRSSSIRGSAGAGSALPSLAAWTPPTNLRPFAAGRRQRSPRSIPMSIPGSKGQPHLRPGRPTFAESLARRCPLPLDPPARLASSEALDRGATARVGPSSAWVGDPPTTGRNANCGRHFRTYCRLATHFRRLCRCRAVTLSARVGAIRPVPLPLI